MSASRKIYGEKEAAELLREAARLQEEVGEDAYSAGVTLEELRRIAKEAGIDPQYLDRAMALGRTSPKERSILNLSEETEHILDGEIPASEFDLLVTALQRHGSVQMGQQLGRTVSAQVTKAPMTANVNLSSRNGRTRLAVRSTPLLAYFLGLHVPLIAATVVGPLVGTHNLVGGIAASAGLVLGGLLAFTGLTKLGKRRAREMGASLASELETFVQPTAAEVLLTGAEQTVENQA